MVLPGAGCVKSRRTHAASGGVVIMFLVLAPFVLLVAAAIASAGATHAEKVLRLEGDIVMWVAPGAGAATSVTYAMLTESYSLPKNNPTLSRDNCGSMRPFAAIVAASPGVSDEMARQQLRAAFAAWQEVAGLEFIEVNDPHKADIIIGATVAASGRAFANLSIRGGRDAQPIAKALGATSDGRPSDRAGPIVERSAAAIDRAYVCLNSKTPWKAGFDGNLDVYDLRYTFMHEIGHAVGLDHPGRSGSIMGYRYDERVHKLQPSDIAAAQSLYGPPRTKLRCSGSTQMDEVTGDADSAWRACLAPRDK